MATDMASLGIRADSICFATARQASKPCRTIRPPTGLAVAPYFGVASGDALIDLLAWMTLQDGVEWLAANTCQQWNERKLLETIIRVVMQEAEQATRAAANAGVPSALWPASNPYSGLCVAPPADTKFISRPILPTHPPGAAALAFAVPWHTIKIRIDRVHQLYMAGSTQIAAAEPQVNEVNADGVPIYAEELVPPVSTTLDMVRVSGAQLQFIGRQLGIEADAAGHSTTLEQPSRPSGESEKPAWPSHLTLISPQVESTSNFESWVTRKELQDAFGTAVLPDAWFAKEPKWLRDAKRQPGRRGQPALYCPYEVMMGLRKKVRMVNRISEPKGWQIMRASFPASHAANRDKRNNTGKRSAEHSSPQ
jgi:hypothetical protein